jgi:formate-dependent nitrite reductase membrane component NrfD
VSPTPQPRQESYYGQPILKPVEWTPLIPLYFFCGGAAAGSAMLAAGMRSHGHERSARRLTFAGTAAVAVSAYCLIMDLGRPARFHHMLRVFKPSSPMSVGTYIFSAFSAANGIATGSALTGVFPGVGRVAAGIAAAVAPALATYTAVLISDTAVPAWHEARRSLPFVFAATSTVSAGALGLILAPRNENAGPRRIALAGAVGALAAMRRLREEAGPIVTEAYETGNGGELAAWAERLTIFGARAALFARRSKTVAVVAGVALLTGALCERFAIFEAGRTTARDPKYVVELQRQ